MKIFMVGGAVRDYLLGVEPKDTDYVVVDSNDHEMIAKGFKRVGDGSFPVYLHPISGDEYALARTENKTGDGYGGFVVSSDGVSLMDDLRRRDLTINSMFIDHDGTVGDYFGGKSDIKSKTLRHTSDAFSEDPVRVLRVARFMARFGSEWTIHPSTKRLMETMRDNGELRNLTPERVWKETERALGENHPELFFQTLEGYGIFPEIDAMRDIPQPVEHHPEGCVFTHTMLVLKRAVELGYPVITRFACLMHDMGKPLSYELYGKLHGHEQMGVDLIKDFCKRLRVPNDFRDLAVLSSDNHTRCHKVLGMSPKKIHLMLEDRFKVGTHAGRFHRFLEVCLCDAQGRGDELKLRDYPQKTFLEDLLKAYTAFDRKAVVSQAIAKGKSGKALGEVIRVEEIAAIRKFVKQWMNDHQL